MISSACRHARPEENAQAPAVRVLTDSASYSLAGPYSRATVQVRLINTSSDTVLLAHCGSAIAVEVQRLDASRWLSVYPGICPTVRYPPDRVPPGETERFPVYLHPGPEVSVSALVGTLRILVAASALRTDARGAREEVQLPLTDRTTAAFTVRQ
jgi:hypothetical protein